MRTRVAAVLAALALCAASACASDDDYVVAAVFADVGDLNRNAAVRIADVPVGVVTDIALDPDLHARVTLRLDAVTELPAGVRARLRKSNVLGERFVELVVDRDSPGVLEPGAVITDTEIVPDLEDVVGSGSELLAAVTADRIAGALAAGAEGLGGRGATLNGLFADLGTLIDTYDDTSADLVTLIDELDRFLAEVGPAAETHGVALGELVRAGEALQRQDDRLLDTLSRMRALSLTGTDIMVAHRRRIDDFFARLALLTDTVAARRADLERLPFELAKHNHNTIRGINAEHAQVLLDFLVCGENDQPGHPVRACDDPPQGQPRPVPRERQR